MSHYPLSSCLIRNILTDAEAEKLLTPYPHKGCPDILTVSDLFQADYSKLKLIASNKKINFEKLVELRQYYLENLMEFKTSAKSIQKLKTGSKLLDDLKIPFPSMIQISGPSGCGKTRWLASCAIETVLAGNPVIFVDSALSLTRNLFAPQKFQKYLRLPNAESMFQIYRIFRLHRLLDLLGLIEHRKDLHNSVLIVDSINSFILDVGPNQNVCDSNISHKRLKMSNFTLLMHSFKTISHLANLTIVFSKMECKEFSLEQASHHLDLELLMERPDQNGSTKINIKSNILTVNPNERSFKISIHNDDEESRCSS